MLLDRQQRLAEQELSVSQQSEAVLQYSFESEQLVKVQHNTSAVPLLQLFVQEYPEQQSLSVVQVSSKPEQFEELVTQVPDIWPDGILQLPVEH